MSTRFQIFCGTDTNGHDVDAKQLALDLAAKYFPNGHSISEETGRWQTWTGRDGGAIVTELTIVITWVASDSLVKTREADAQVSRLAGEFKNRAFQEAVLITRQEIDAVFV
jgi:hypothetical protein